MIDWAAMFSATEDAPPSECVAASAPVAEDDGRASTDDAVPRLITGEDDDDADFWRLAGADDRSRPVIDFGLIDSGGGCLIGEPCDAPEVLLVELRGRYGRRLCWTAVRRCSGNPEEGREDVSAGR